MITTTPIDKKWLARLELRGLTANSVFEDGRYEGLKKKLLAIGGQAVVFLGEIPNYDLLLEKAKLFVGNRKFVKIRRGSPNACFNNVEELAKQSPELQSYEGFSLSEDGVWRSHSWLYDYSTLTLIETTVPRLAYYGI